MKATGIVRRIDELGRVAMAEGIRRTKRVREGGGWGYCLENLPPTARC